MASENSQKPVSRICKKQHPTEALEIGPEEYRDEVSEAAREIVSGIKSSVRPTTSSTTEQQADSQQGITSKPFTFDNKNRYLLRRKAQVVVASIENTLHPTAKPKKPSEVTGHSGHESDEDGPFAGYVKGWDVNLDNIQLSDRMEYLARPKKGVLYKHGFECPDGAIPEKHLPTWKFLPLHKKIPADLYPYQINMAQVSEDLIVSSPPRDGLDMSSIRPAEFYNSLHDPQLKDYFERKEVRQQLEESGLVTQSGRVVCTLKQLNDYREYLARVQARSIQLKLRQEFEEEKRKKEKKLQEEADKKQEELYKEKTQTALREQLKNAVSESQKDQTISQMEKDKRVINRKIELKAKFKQRALERQERFDRLNEKRINDKREQEKRRKEMALEIAKRDVERIEELCRRKKEEKMERRRKLEDFWERKAAHQSEWLEKGMELERQWQQEKEERVKERDERVWQARMETEKGMRNTSSGRSETDSNGYESDNSSDTIVCDSDEMTLEDILKNENESKGTKSKEILRGNPSREEAVQPVPAYVMTLEQMLKNEEDGYSTTEESSRGEVSEPITTFSEATLHLTDSDGTTDLTSSEERMVGPWYKGAARRTSSEEETLRELLKNDNHLSSTDRTTNQDSKKETSDRGSEKENDDRSLTQETSGLLKENSNRGLTQETSDRGSKEKTANRGLTKYTSKLFSKKKKANRGSKEETIVYTKTKKKEYFSKEKPPTSTDETTD